MLQLFATSLFFVMLDGSPRTAAEESRASLEQVSIRASEAWPSESALREQPSALRRLDTRSTTPPLLLKPQSGSLKNSCVVSQVEFRFNLPAFSTLSSRVLFCTWLE